MLFDLKTPCANCPFRSDIKPFLTGGRAREIADALRRDMTFACHKTVDYSDEADEGEGRETKKTRHCVGALMVCEQDGHIPQLARIAERMGFYDHTRLAPDAPVYESLDEFVEAHEQS